jgi:hypothetical protein
LVATTSVYGTAKQSAPFTLLLVLEEHRTIADILFYVRSSRILPLSQRQLASLDGFATVADSTMPYGWSSKERCK